jgi:hypothetical protein
MPAPTTAYSKLRASTSSPRKVGPKRSSRKPQCRAATGHQSAIHTQDHPTNFDGPTIYDIDGESNNPVVTRPRHETCQQRIDRHRQPA